MRRLWQGGVRASSADVLKANLVVSPVAHKPSLRKMGIETDRIVNVGSFSEGQRHFLDYHRNAVLLKIAR